MKKVFLGIGTNLGDRESNLKAAVASIEEHVGIVVMQSSVYETEPWGFESDEQFLNIVVKVETGLSSSGLLGRILMIESVLGRVRNEKQYSSRVIDIDILFYSDIVVDEVSLIIPHPKIQQRRFILVPLCEIDPGFIHPVLKKPLSSILEMCEDKSYVKKYVSTD